MWPLAGSRRFRVSHSGGNLKEQSHRGPCRLGTTVNIPVIEVDLAEFARQVSADPQPSRRMRLENLTSEGDAAWVTSS